MIEDPYPTVSIFWAPSWRARSSNREKRSCRKVHSCSGVTRVPSGVKPTMSDWSTQTQSKSQAIADAADSSSRSRGFERGRSRIRIYEKEGIELSRAFERREAKKPDPMRF